LDQVYQIQHLQEFILYKKNGESNAGQNGYHLSTVDVTQSTSKTLFPSNTNSMWVWEKNQTARWSNHQTVKPTRSSTWTISQHSEDLFPGDSKCPFHPLVGGHLTP